MTFIETFLQDVKEINFKKFYKVAEYKLDYQKFIKLPCYLQLNIINTYLITKFGICIYTLPYGLYIYKLSLDHEPTTEVIRNGSYDDQGVIAKLRYKSSHFIPTDKELIQVYSKIRHLLKHDPF